MGTETQDTHVKMQQEEHHPTAKERDKEEFNPVDSFALDIQPPELRENTFWSVVFYGSSSRQTQRLTLFYV